jgi:hypothetical protein
MIDHWPIGHHSDELEKEIEHRIIFINLGKVVRGAIENGEVVPPPEREDLEGPVRRSQRNQRRSDEMQAKRESVEIFASGEGGSRFVSIQYVRKLRKNRSCHVMRPSKSQSPGDRLA